jgi:hypothetical protein
MKQREIFWGVIKAICLFLLSVLIIFIPPVMLFYTILGVIGMFGSIGYLIYLILIIELERYNL